MTAGDEGGEQNVHSGLIAEVVEGQPSAQLLEEGGGTARLDYELKKTQIAFLFFLMSKLSTTSIFGALKIVLTLTPLI